MHLHLPIILKLYFSLNKDHREILDSEIALGAYPIKPATEAHMRRNVVCFKLDHLIFFIFIPAIVAQVSISHFLLKTRLELVLKFFSFKILDVFQSFNVQLLISKLEKRIIFFIEEEFGSEGDNFSLVYNVFIPRNFCNMMIVVSDIGRSSFLAS